MGEKRNNSWEQLSHLLIAHLCCHMCACTGVHTCINKMQLKCFYSTRILITLDAVSHNSVIQKIVVEAGMMHAPIVSGIWMLGSHLVALFGGGFGGTALWKKCIPASGLWGSRGTCHSQFAPSAFRLWSEMWTLSSRLSASPAMSSSFHALPLWCWYTRLSGALSPKHTLLSIKCPGYCLITAIEK